MIRTKFVFNLSSDENSEEKIFCQKFRAKKKSNKILKKKFLTKDFQFFFFLDFAGKWENPTNEFENSTKSGKIGTLGSCAST